MGDRTSGHVSSLWRLLARPLVAGTTVASMMAFGAITAQPAPAGAAALSFTALSVNDVSDSVSPIDTSTNTSGSQIGVGTVPLGIAVAPDGKTAYVVNGGPNTFSPIDLTTSPPTAHSAISLGSGVSGANWIAITPDGHTALVTAPGSNQVVPINLTTTPPTVGAPVNIGSGTGSEGIAITPDGHTAYVANFNNNTVTPIDLTQSPPVAGTAITSSTFNHPFGIAITPNGNTAYVTNHGAGTVTPIDLTTLTPTVGTAITVGTSPTWVAITPDGQTALVTNNGSASVTPIATSTNTAGSAVTGNGLTGSAPYAIAITPDGNTAYVTDGNGHTLTPIALNGITLTAGTAINVGSDPRGLAIVPDQAPEAGFSVTPHPATQATAFDATVSRAATGITNYAWAFGDGVTATTTTPNTTHIYAVANTYTVTLTVTDGAGTSTSQVFTGQTLSRNGSAVATTTRQFMVGATEPPAPTVGGVNPLGGPTGGGTSVTITGTAFNGVTSVDFGPLSATGFTVNSPTQITATAPPSQAGTDDVTVTGPGGTSATGTADQYTYARTPFVASVSPSSGPTVGGTAVTISGNNFASNATVDFGSNAATHVVVNQAGTQITAQSPAGAAGTTDVTVATLAGTSPTSASDHFTYGEGSISGRAVDGSGNPLPAIVVACLTTGCQQVNTDVNGGFQFSNLINGSYGVTAFPATRALIPQTAHVTITNGNNVTGLVLTDAPIPSLPAGVTYTSPTYGVETSSTGIPRLWWTEPTQVTMAPPPAGSGAVIYKQATVVGTSLFGGGTLTAGVALGGSLNSPAGPLPLGQASVSYTVPPLYPIHGPVTFYTGSVQYPPGQAPVSGVAAPLSIEMSPEILTQPVQFVDFGYSTITVGGATLQGANARDFKLAPLNTVGGAVGQQTDCGVNPAPLLQDTVFSTDPPADTRCGVAVTWLHPAGKLVDSALLEEQTSLGKIPVLVTACDDTVLACGAIDLQQAAEPDEPDEPTAAFGATSGGSSDPSGQVQAHTPSGTFPAVDATVTLLMETSGTFSPVPANSEFMSPDNRNNPVTTGASGLYGWDVLPGTYEVTASKPGCTPTPYTTPPIVVPPPATGVNLPLNCPALTRTASTIALAASPPSTGAGRPVTLTAHVQSHPTGPTGTVAFQDGATVLATVPVNPGTGNATYTTSALAPGAHHIQANYSGDGNDAPTSTITTVTIASLPASLPGYRMVASDGGIFGFGPGGKFFGSAATVPLAEPIVGMAATPDGNGYWLVASDGGIFTYGDAKYYGSTGNIHLNKPIVGMATTPDGRGYWLVATDGGIFTFGDARYHGSTGNIHLNQPIIGMKRSLDGNGYWLAASDGGIFSFGAAPALGSEGGALLARPIVAIS